MCLGPVLDDPMQNRRLQYDHGQAAMSMALAAADLGIGTSHAAVTDQELARTLLGFPDGSLLRSRCSRSATRPSGR